MNKATIATKDPIAGVQRKLAWFKLQPRGLYFECGSPTDGSHTSYHSDGNVFRTSPATGGRAKKNGSILPVKQFRGWHQFSVAMVDKGQLRYNPPLRSRDRSRATQLVEVDIAAMPANCLNLVVDVLHREDLGLLEGSELRTPPGATEVRFQLDDLVLVVTIIGDEGALLIRPNDQGFTVNHYNERFSANRSGVEYSWEAYR